MDESTLTLKVVAEPAASGKRYRLYLCRGGERFPVDTTIDAGRIGSIDPCDVVLTDDGLNHRQITISLLRPAGLLTRVLGGGSRLYVVIKSLEIDGTDRLPQRNSYVSRDNGETWSWIRKVPTKKVASLHRVKLEFLEASET